MLGLQLVDTHHEPHTNRNRCDLRNFADVFISLHNLLDPRNRKSGLTLSSNYALWRLEHSSIIMYCRRWVRRSNEKRIVGGGDAKLAGGVRVKYVGRSAVATGRGQNWIINFHHFNVKHAGVYESQIKIPGQMAEAEWDCDGYRVSDPIYAPR